MFRAVQRGNVREVERLVRLKNVDVNGRHQLGWSLLHLAAVNGRQEVNIRTYLLLILVQYIKIQIYV